MYYDLKYGIINLWKYRKIIWKDRDWDQYFLLELMSFKMKNMSDLQRYHGHHVDCDTVADELYYASELAHMLAEEDFTKHIDEFYNKYKLNTQDIMDFALRSDSIDLHRDEFMEAMELDRKELEKSQEKFFELLKRYERWWD